MDDLYAVPLDVSGTIKRRQQKPLHKVQELLANQRDRTEKPKPFPDLKMSASKRACAGLLPHMRFDSRFPISLQDRMIRVKHDNRIVLRAIQILHQIEKAVLYEPPTVPSTLPSQYRTLTGLPDTLSKSFFTNTHGKMLYAMNNLPTPPAIPLHSTPLV